MATLQEIYNAVFDEATGQFNLSGATTSTASPVTIDEVSNEIYDSSGNTIKTVTT